MDGCGKDEVGQLNCDGGTFDVNIGDGDAVQVDEVDRVQLDDLDIAREEEIEDVENDNPMDDNGNVRIKQRNPQTWKCNIRKAKRNAGEAYIAKSGKEVPEKKYQYVECKCRWECGEKVPDKSRREIHQQFWAIKDWNNQTQLL